MGETGPRVLLVDDDPVILQLLQVNFEMEGFRVVTATDGEVALEVVRASPPDVVVTDVSLPNLSGLDLARALKADAVTAAVPVVVVSARAHAHDVREGIEAGADDYVTKPFEPIDLVARVHALLRP